MLPEKSSSDASRAPASGVAEARVSLQQCAILIALSIFVSVVLAEIYRAFSFHDDVPRWLPALTVNAALAIVVLLAARLWIPGMRKPVAAVRWFAESKIRIAMPALAILIGSLALVALASVLPGSPDRETPLSWNLAVFVLLVPIVEEIVFRQGLGTFFRKIGGVWWGSYFSAFTFAFVHSSPTLDRIAGGSIGLALGPLLLGLACEAVYLVGGRLWGAVALHAACNFTVVIFLMGDGRILHWLDFLYQ